jgi:hypothetical protein
MPREFIKEVKGNSGTKKAFLEEPLLIGIAVCSIRRERTGQIIIYAKSDTSYPLAPVLNDTHDQSYPGTLLDCLDNVRLKFCCKYNVSTVINALKPEAGRHTTHPIPQFLGR